MRIALLGTRGVPARYGGFETCVEEVGRRLVAMGHQVNVYCRTSPGEPEPVSSYEGMHLIALPSVHHRVLETLSHTALSVVHRSIGGADAAIVFNAANAPLLPVLRARGVPVATHVDGLEWLRGKWGPVGKRYYRRAESLAVRWSDALIADAQGIADYYTSEFGAQTELIAYGAPIQTEPDLDRLDEINLHPAKYHLLVARFEPENHVEKIIRGFVASRAELPLVVVGSVPYATEYTEQIHAAADHRVTFLGGVWDQQLLDQLYAGALTYLHGHSVGGTNPSLLRAAGAGAYTIAFDVGFNREVLGEHAAYFRSSADVAALVEGAEADPSGPLDEGLALQQAIRRYDWDDVALRYEQLCRRLVEPGARSRPRPSGRRSSTSRRSSHTPGHATSSAANAAPNQAPNPAPGPAWSQVQSAAARHAEGSAPARSGRRHQ